jgi:hypothetical protein
MRTYDNVMRKIKGKTFLIEKNERAITQTNKLIAK